MLFLEKSAFFLLKNEVNGLRLSPKLVCTTGSSYSSLPQTSNSCSLSVPVLLTVFFFLSTDLLSPFSLPLTILPFPFFQHSVAFTTLRSFFFLAISLFSPSLSFPRSPFLSLFPAHLLSLSFPHFRSFLLSRPRQLLFSLIYFSPLFCSPYSAPSPSLTTLLLSPFSVLFSFSLPFTRSTLRLFPSSLNFFPFFSLSFPTSRCLSPHQFIHQPPHALFLRLITSSLIFSLFRIVFLFFASRSLSLSPPLI